MIAGGNNLKSLIKKSKLFLDSLSDPIFIVDNDLRVQYANKKSLSQLGYTAEEVIGKLSCAELCKSPFCNTDNCTIKTALRNKSEVIETTVVTDRNGKKIPVRASCNAIFDTKGKPIGGFEMVNNIETLDDGFLSNMADMAFRTDNKLIVQNINDAALKALGFTREEVVGKMSCSDLTRTPVCGTENCTIKKCMETRKTVVATTVAKTREGAIIPVRASCGPLINAKGEISGGFEIINPVDNLDEGFLSNMADMAFRVDKNLIIQNINDVALKATGYTREEVVGKMKCADLSRTPLCNSEECTIKRCMASRNTIVAETYATTRDGKEVPIRAACGPLIDAQGNITGGFEVISDNSDLTLMIEKLSLISQGDMTVEIDNNVKSRDDIVGQVAKSLDSMVDKLSGTIANIITGAQGLAQATQEISAGNENLSQRTAEQASSLEEIASTIEESNATIAQNAQNAEFANKKSQETSDMARDGGEIMRNAVSAINDINESGKKIEEIISVINDIAFQTNLLALNAAVEAARAGEQGRGFAVVAGEVRNLAQRSGNAAKEIGQLIKETIQKVENGTDLANKSGTILNEIIKQVETVTQNVAEIAAATHEQKQGTGQINTAIAELDSMTQQNAGLVEETASASEEMSNQAQELLVMMDQFKINAEMQASMQKKKETFLKSAHLADSNGNSQPAVISPAKLQINKQAEAPKGDKIEEILCQEGFEEF